MEELNKTIDKSTRDKMVNDNIGLVGYVARKFMNRGYEYDDIFQIGCIGLIKAVNNFDNEKYNNKFSTYAVPMIEGEIKRFLRDDGEIKIPRSLKQLKIKVIIAKRNLEFQLGREPTIKELSEYTGINEEDLGIILNSLSVYRFDSIVNNDSDSKDISLIDIVSKYLSVNEEENNVNRLMLQEALKLLTDKERKVIEMTYYDDMIQTSIAGKLGISQVQVSRLIKRALIKIRKYFEGGYNMSKRKDVFDWLDENYEGQKTSEIADKFGISVNVMYNYKSQWLKLKGKDKEEFEKVSEDKNNDLIVGSTNKTEPIQKPVTKSMTTKLEILTMTVKGKDFNYTSTEQGIDVEAPLIHFNSKDDLKIFYDEVNRIFEMRASM